MGLAALVTGAAVGAAPANAQTGTAVEVMRLRFGDKLRRASKMLDELQSDIANDVRGSSDGRNEWSECRRAPRRERLSSCQFVSLSRADEHVLMIACAVVAFSPSFGVDALRSLPYSTQSHSARENEGVSVCRPLVFLRIDRTLPLFLLAFGRCAWSPWRSRGRTGTWCRPTRTRSGPWYRCSPSTRTRRSRLTTPWTPRQGWRLGETGRWLLEDSTHVCSALRKQRLPPGVPRVLTSSNNTPRSTASDARGI